MSQIPDFHSICDFCSEPQPVREFTAESFQVLVGERSAVSVSSWLACTPCAELVDREDRAALEDRALAQMFPELGLDPVTGPLLRAQIRIAHDLFFQYRRAS